MPCARTLAQLVPEARVDVGHGQMPEHQLEHVMHRFNHGLTDVLLSTTIIESGLDIPNANTLIVDRADTFGLAQLYQLRGRVGRGAARAYAYFFRHRRRMPTADAQQRMDVIAENTELGAGYSIAMRDLEIRGAGRTTGQPAARPHSSPWIPSIHPAALRRGAPTAARVCRSEALSPVGPSPLRHEPCSISGDRFQCP